MQRGADKGFSPEVPAQCGALMLGTYPSVKSFEHRYYYGHPQNRFWPLLALLAGTKPPVGIEERRNFILCRHLALWDTLERCDITGSADSSIKNPRPNNIAALVQEKGIGTIFCNGGAALNYYNRFHRQLTGIEAVGLPSTSPANAAFSLARLQAAWAPVAAFLVASPHAITPAAHALQEG